MSKTTDERLERYLTAAFGFIVLSVINLLNAWFVMLALGVAHHEWPQIPAWGYWATYLVFNGIAAVAGGIKGGLKVDTKTKS